MTLKQMLGLDTRADRYTYGVDPVVGVLDRRGARLVEADVIAVAAGGPLEERHAEPRLELADL